MAKKILLIEAQEDLLRLRSGDPGLTEDQVRDQYVKAEMYAQKMDARLSTHFSGLPQTKRNLISLGVNPDTLEKE